MEELKPCPFTVGEEVFIDGPYQRCSIGRVSKITKTMVILEGAGMRFRYNGHQVGGNVWSRYMIKKLTPERKDMFIVQNLKTKASLLRGKLPIPNTKEELRAFIRAIEPFIKEREG